MPTVADQLDEETLVPLPPPADAASADDGDAAAEDAETTPEERLLAQQAALAGSLAVLQGQLVTVSSTLRNMGINLRAHTKESQRYARQVSIVTKQAAAAAAAAAKNGGGRKRRRNNAPVDPDAPPKPPTGFLRPVEISAALCRFLGEAEGTLMSRVEVSRRINAYVKDNDLRDPEDRRRILLDGALRALLGVEEGIVVNSFSIQKYMKVHFPAKAASA